MRAEAMRFFVSFAHVDRVRVAMLADVLARAGFQVWWDDHLNAGDDWEAELMRQVDDCEVFLYLVSPDSNESEWCRWELRQARALSKFIVPLIIRDGVELPPEIGRLQYVDVSTGLDNGEFVRLIERLLSLRQTATRESTSSAAPRGSPARFTRQLPKSYRTVAQGFLRPAAPGIHRHEWAAPFLDDDDEVTGPVIGIDFGTTTSAIAFHDVDGIRLIPSRWGELTTPSAVAIDVDGEPIVGQRAVDFLLRRPERGVLEVKRLFGHELVTELGGAPMLQVDGISYSPTDLAAFVLARLRADADAHFGRQVRRAVLAAPAYFDPSQLGALTQAARLAGWTILRVVSEPVAACLGIRGGTPSQDVLAVTYDLGGGTFDVSVVERGEGVIDVKAVNGDTRLGGADFDREVVEYCAGEFVTSTGIDVRGNAVALMRLRAEAERCKIEMSSLRTVNVRVPFVARGPSGWLDLDVELTRVRYNELTHQLVARSIALTQTVIEDAGTTVADVGEVLVVGRAASAPSVRTAIRDMFGDRVRFAPDQVVALGAAVQAGVLAGTVKDVLLLDTITNTLRVQVSDGRAVPVIPRNRSMPAKHQVTLTAQSPSAPSVLVRILAGESSWSNRNAALAEVQLLCTLGIRRATQVKVQLEVDANSYLSLEVTDGDGVTTTKERLLWLRGDTQSGIESEDRAQLTPTQEALLPAYTEIRGLRPLPEASLGDLRKVQRWLLDAATNVIVDGGRRRWSLGRAVGDDELERSKTAQAWLRAHPDLEVPEEIAVWRLFDFYDIERELLVDALEQRLGIELTRLRYCQSISSMSKRLVETVRESPR